MPWLHTSCLSSRFRLIVLTRGRKDHAPLLFRLSNSLYAISLPHQPNRRHRTLTKRSIRRTLQASPQARERILSARPPRCKSRVRRGLPPGVRTQGIESIDACMNAGNGTPDRRAVASVRRGASLSPEREGSESCAGRVATNDHAPPDESQEGPPEAVPSFGPY